MSKPRLSGIPTPGRSSSIPTPGRSRSSSSATAIGEVREDVDAEYMSKALADAIKSNNPALHRERAGDVHSTSLSPMNVSTSSTSISGRSSVSSAYSSASMPKPPPTRSKTPVSVRPQSRQSDVFARSSSRAGKTFEVGDNVRIESLGFEGVLRYFGAIDGKPGLWAGVELSKGFAGKGKNDGSVGGKQYFTCADKCGVFVASSKISPPTVGYGARPSSVASSRSGRVTPAFSSGRITPSTSSKNTRTPSVSLSNGRITPSGRATPSYPETPAVRAARMRAAATNKSQAGATPAAVVKNATRNSNDSSRSSSQASKYAAMPSNMPSFGSPSSPSRVPSTSLPSPMRANGNRTISSPSRPNGSPFSTPKPRISNASGLGVTPKPRVPSGVAMPPPASPSAHRQNSLADDDVVLSSTDLEQRGKSLQDKIAALTRNNSITDSQSGRQSMSPARSPHRRSDSSISGRSSVAEEERYDQMQSRIAALEYDNQRLRSSVSTPPEDVPGVDPELQAKVEALEESRSLANARVAELERMLLETQSSLNSREDTIAEFEAKQKAYLSDAQAHQEKAADAESLLITAYEEAEILKMKLEDNEKDVARISEESKALAEEQEKSIQLEREQKEQAEVEWNKKLSEFEEERKDLNMQVDELRQAGQETIALYEERLRSTELKRYELEDKVTDLEAKLSVQVARSPQPNNSTPTMVQIENEGLQDQVVHLQKKVSTLEDMLEDSRASAEKEETLIRDRMRRVKEKEDAMKKEIGDSRKEVERVLKAEAAARNRVEEIEEALRESTIALENAQAEIEGLRADLDHANGLVASSSASEQLKSFESQNLQLQQKAEDQESQLILAQQTLQEQTTELEGLRKRANREMTVNGPSNSAPAPAPPSTPSKHDLSKAREEIKGLKHIVGNLQQETSSMAQEVQMLQSENQLLKTEADRLREEVKILEENLDNSIMREEQGLDDMTKGSDDADAESLKRLLKEQRLKFETELEQLRKRLADVEMKSARTTHDLNKEISELEALVESKIYREDELEQEIERLKDKVSRQKKLSKNSLEAPDLSQRDRGMSSASSVHSVQSEGTTATNSEADQARCEICDKPGHDIFTCDLLKDDAPTPAPSKSTSMLLWCDECESHGHLTADCPHAEDVF